ncbi:hypothetical protein FACS1894193_05950 [Bacilli bacterium]|nr:hypothetical protein FACS1894192_07310 [Bacilli bacterium]GHU41699.1 hypothetical protein FACS1894193_05950 [Bacilli bacterium]
MKTQVLLDLTTHRVVSFAFAEGHCHDFKLFKESIGATLPEEFFVVVDLGYQGILNFHENTFIPAKRSKKHELTEEEKALNREISKIRMEIQHFNAVFKTFQIMALPYRNRRRRFDYRAELICGFIHFERD